MTIGAILLYYWWQNLHKHKATRRKLLDQGVKIRYWRTPWQGLNTPTGVPVSLEGRLLLFLVTIVTPAACFVIASDSNFPFTTSPWQSGSALYPEILLGRDTTPYFYPFALYGSLSALALLISPDRASRYFPIRFGIYSGTALAMHFSILLLTQGMLILCLVFGVGLLLPIGIFTLVTYYSYDTDSRPFLWLTVGLAIWLLYLLPAALTSNTIWFDAVGPIALFTLIGFVVWVFPIGLWLSIRLIQKEKEWTTRKTGAVIAWLIAYFIALQAAITRMYIIYNNLPTSPPPDCYIATAAAQGYPRLVGSFETTTADGQPFRINRQLQRLKAAELILLALSPKTHRAVRKVYDVWGRYTAQKITHPAVATLVYWSLKPAEWVTKLLLMLLGNNCRLAVQKFYQHN